jgi:lysozyme
MQTSDAGIKQLQGFEGFRTTPYQDIVGKWTVGYGHLMIPGDGTEIHQNITVEQGEALLRKDLHTAEECINANCDELTQNEFDALVSFTFNLGCSAFERSTLLKFIKAKNFEAAAKEFPKWNMAGGKISQGLLRRRLAEQETFLHGIYRSI